MPKKLKREMSIIRGGGLQVIRHQPFFILNVTPTGAIVSTDSS